MSTGEVKYTIDHIWIILMGFRLRSKKREKMHIALVHHVRQREIQAKIDELSHLLAFRGVVNPTDEQVEKIQGRIRVLKVELEEIRV